MGEVGEGDDGESDGFLNSPVTVEAMFKAERPDPAIKTGRDRDNTPVNAKGANAREPNRRAVLAR